MSGHNHTRFRNGDGPWSVCPSTCPESTSVMGELHRLREVVRRVEELAVEFSSRQVKAIVASSQHPLDSASMAKEVGKGIGFAFAARMTRDALWPDEGSTDTGPAPAGAHAATQGAGECTCAGPLRCGVHEGMWP